MSLFYVSLFSKETDIVVSESLKWATVIMLTGLFAHINAWFREFKIKIDEVIKIASQVEKLSLKFDVLSANMDRHAIDNEIKFRDQESRIREHGSSLAAIKGDIRVPSRPGKEVLQ